MTPAPGAVEVGEVAVLPDPRNFDGWLAFVRNGCSAVIPNGRSRDNISVPTPMDGS